MNIYQDLISSILRYGTVKGDRTGTGTISLFGCNATFELDLGFPIVTVKETHFKSVIHELLWFLQGDTNAKHLQENGVKIWNEWADPNTGDLGPIYGHQWRFWKTPSGETIDQISQVIEQIKHNPNSRRIMMTAWNPADLPDESLSPHENVKRGRMALAPCHTFAQFYVAEERLSCAVYCRSQDMVLGTPFNWASYGLLTHMIAQQCDLKVGELVWFGGDCHIYMNHRDAADEILAREPFPLPQLIIKRTPASIFEYKYEDFDLFGYQRYPAIKAKIAI